ncbi:MAG: hypothetical protein P1U89_13690 [Verrucomicrobiales bacterium]|nr:hypothetical protein [Verrucomicrobiales bacterium]
MTPFTSDIVTNPRNLGPVVESLNQDILTKLTRFVHSICQDAPHKPIPSPKVEHLGSINRGTGKSHVLGRLFNSVSTRATRIYFPPFQDPKTAWSHVLHLLVEEFRRPEFNSDSKDPNDPDQLDAFAHGIFGHALAELVDLQRVTVTSKDDVDIVPFLRAGLSDHWDLANPDLPLTKAFHAAFDELEIFLEEQIDTLQSDQQIKCSNLSPILRVLRQYAKNRQDYKTRKLCVMWLKSIPYKGIEAYSEIGLESSEMVQAESENSTIEGNSRQRIIDLCILASYYRPFIFCFDQADYYVNDEDLAGTFASVLDYLHRFAPNQATIIACNKQVWDTIKGSFQEAFLDGISKEINDLRGIQLEQGRELIKLRMGEGEQKKLDYMLDEQWLESQFGATGTVVVRNFLRACETRYLGFEIPLEEADIESVFENRVADLKSNRQQMLTYDAGLLRWIVNEIMILDYPHYQSESFKSKKDYYPIIWESEAEAPIIFGFESGDNNATWGARLREGKRLFDEEQIHTVHLRIAGSRQIPPPSWKIAPQFAEAEEYFRIVTIPFEDIVAMHALRQLTFDAHDKTNDFDPADIMKFGTNELKHISEMVVGKPAPVEVAQPAESEFKDLAEKVEQMVKPALFISMTQVRNQLLTQHKISVTENDILSSCHQMENIEIYTTGNQISLNYQV